MRIGLSPGSLVEAAVTLAVALLMTDAGSQALQGAVPSTPHEIAVPAQPADVALPPSAHVERIAMPHVDELRA